MVWDPLVYFFGGDLPWCRCPGLVVGDDPFGSFCPGLERVWSPVVAKHAAAEEGMDPLWGSSCASSLLCRGKCVFDFL